MNGAIGMSDLQIVETLETITRLQAEVITELFTLLQQHISAEEADRLPCVAKINTAAALRASMDGKAPAAK